MSDLDAYGPVFLPSMLEDDVEAILRLWMAACQAVVVRVDETHRATLSDAMRDAVAPLSLAPIRSFNPVDAVDRDWPDDQLPAVIVAAGPTTDAPNRDGHGTHRVPYRLEVAILTASNARRHARRNAAGHATAAKLAIGQQLKKASPRVAGLKFAGERPGTVRVGNLDESTVASYQIAFDITVPDTFNDLLGPLTPPVDPTVPGATGPEIADPVVVTVTRT